MPTESSAILFNPSAGKGSAQRKKHRLEKLLRRWEVPHELIATRSADDLRFLTRECAGRFKAVIGAGGDSTFQIMADELARSGAEVDLGMIPLGSSNDIPREFGLNSLEKACHALKTRRTRRIDLGTVHCQGQVLAYFLGQANIGLGVQVNRYVEGLSRRWQRLAALQGLAGFLGIRRSYRTKTIPVALAVDGNGQEQSGRFVVAAFSNIRFWASGRILSPAARPDDGLLDGCLIRSCSFLRLARLSHLAARGRHVGAPEVTFLLAPQFRIASDQAFSVQVDGEIVGGYESPGSFRDIEVGIVPKALKLIW